MFGGLDVIWSNIDVDTGWSWIRRKGKAGDFDMLVYSFYSGWGTLGDWTDT